MTASRLRNTGGHEVDGAVGRVASPLDCRRYAYSRMPAQQSEAHACRTRSPRVSTANAHGIWVHANLILSRPRERASRRMIQRAPSLRASWSVLRGRFAAPQDEDSGRQAISRQRRTLSFTVGEIGDDETGDEASGEESGACRLADKSGRHFFLGCQRRSRRRTNRLIAALRAA